MLPLQPLKTKVSVTLDDDLLEEIRANAERQDRTLSRYINLVLRRYLASDLHSSLED